MTGVLKDNDRTLHQQATGSNPGTAMGYAPDAFLYFNGIKKSIGQALAENQAWHINGVCRGQEG